MGKLSENYKFLTEEYISDEGLRQRQKELAKRLGLKHLGRGVYSNAAGSKFVYNKDANTFEPISEDDAKSRMEKKGKKQQTQQPPLTQVDQKEPIPQVPPSASSTKVVYYSGRDPRTGKPFYKFQDSPILKTFKVHDEVFNVHQDPTKQKSPSAGNFSVSHALTGARIVTDSPSLESAQKDAEGKLSTLSKEKLSNLLTRFEQDHPPKSAEEENDPTETNKNRPKVSSHQMSEIVKKQIGMGGKMLVKGFAGLPDSERVDFENILKNLVKADTNDKLEKLVLNIKSGKSSFSKNFVRMVTVADFLKQTSPQDLKNFYNEMSGKTRLPKPTKETLDVIKWDSVKGNMVKIEVPVISSFEFGGVPFHIHRSVAKLGKDWKMVRNNYSVTSDFGGRILDDVTPQKAYRRALRLMRERGEEKVKEVLSKYKAATSDRF